MNKILIMGQSGSGKTTFTEKLVNEFHSRNIGTAWLNADDVRAHYNDWDFSVGGRIRAAERMNELAQDLDWEFVFIDMICPTMKTRLALDPDFIILMDTVKDGPYEDTNQIFDKPDCSVVDVCFNSYPEIEEVEEVADKILNWF